MLILTRKRGQVIRIGDEIILTVLDIKDYQVRIGIDAPQDVSIHREESLNQPKRETANEERGN